jgi:hypothetical protein
LWRTRTGSFSGDVNYGDRVVRWELFAWREIHGLAEDEITDEDDDAEDGAD